MPKSNRRKRAKQTNIEQPVPVEPVSVPAPERPTAPAPVIETTNMIPGNGGTLVLQPAGGASWTQEPAAPSEGWTLRKLGSVITVEVAAYVAIGLIALLLRIVNLDARPLAPAEAETAAAAWNFLNGHPVGTFSSPLLFTLNWLTFLLFGSFDLTARILPAALSTLLVLLPALTRNALGRTGALLAALIIAFSPTLVFIARSLSAADLAVGAALGALLFFWNYRETRRNGALYAAAALAGLSLTADASAFTLLVTGAIYFGITVLLARRETTPETATPNERGLRNPYIRAAIFFAAAFILSSTTFLLNRDGLGVAFNLLGDWFAGFSSFGNFISPLNWLLVYEPLPLIFGLAGVVLTLTLRGGENPGIGLLRLLAVLALVSFVVYTIAGNKNPSVVTAVGLPLMFLAGWFIGNLLERAGEDVAASSEGTSRWGLLLAGEIPIFVMLMVSVGLIYLQIVSFLQNTRFSPALDSLYAVLSQSPNQVSFAAAAATLGLVTLLLFGVFVGLSILLIGAARTTTLLAIVILVLLGLGTLRGLWHLNFSTTEPLRELVQAEQTPLQIRDLVHDIEFMSEARNGDSHVIRIAADPALGAAGQWYLRVFPNVVWSTQPDAQGTAQLILTTTGNPPAGNWMGQQYEFEKHWEPAGFEGLQLWKWVVFRDGGGETARRVTMWLPTETQ